MRHSILAASAISLILGLGLGMTMQGTSFAEKSSKEPYERLDIFAQVLSVIERNYVDKTDRTAMINGAIHGMVRALDPHSSFMSASERKDFEQRTSGQFVGVGMEVGLKNDELRIITTFYGGPAQKAGLYSGDTIIAIDGRDVSKMSLDELFSSLKGEAGSTVKLSIRHPGKMGIEVYSIQRALVQLEMARSLILNDDYGYVALSSFGSGAAQKVKDEIEKINGYTKNGLKGLILDLRKNPGGFLNEGVAIANLFIPSGNIVSTRGRDGVSIQSYDASRTQHKYDMPLAVLIDEGSASASEIVAGALQDHHRAIIVGQTSFGKASIQNMFQLPDGSSMKLTIGRYYTPSGRCIQGQGIVPDVEVEDLILQVRKRPAVREKDLDNALSAQYNGSKQKTGEEQPSGNGDAAQESEDAYKPGDPLPSIDDLQLFTALQQLRAREFFLQKAD